MPSEKSPRHSLDGDDGGSERGVGHSPAHSSEPSTPAPPTPSTPINLHAPDDPPYFPETWCVVRKFLYVH